MNFLMAVVIGVAIGLIGWFAVLRNRQSNAIWLAPLLGAGGAVIASILATVFGDRRDYGYKEITLQFVLAIAAVGALAFMSMRKSTATPAGSRD